MKSDLFQTQSVSVPVWVLIPWLAVTVLIATLVLIMWLSVRPAQTADQFPEGATSHHGPR
jgi:hypothetical protein